MARPHKAPRPKPRRPRLKPNHASETVSDWEQRMLKKHLPWLAVVLARLYGEIALQLVDVMEREDGRSGDGF